MAQRNTDPGAAAQPTAVLLIAHGSRQPAANRDLVELAERIASAGDYTTVEPCFLELAEPDIPTGVDRCAASGAARVLMVPYFLSAGIHLERDLASARDAAAREHPAVAFELAPPLGPHPLLDALVRARIQELETPGN